MEEIRAADILCEGTSRKVARRVLVVSWCALGLWAGLEFMLPSGLWFFPAAAGLPIFVRLLYLDERYSLNWFARAHPRWAYLPVGVGMLAVIWMATTAIRTHAGAVNAGVFVDTQLWIPATPMLITLLAYDVWLYRLFGAR